MCLTQLLVLSLVWNLRAASEPKQQHVAPIYKKIHRCTWVIFIAIVIKKYIAEMNRYTENTICTRNCVCTDIPTKIRTDIHVFGISVQRVVVSAQFFFGISLWRCRTVHYGLFCWMRGPARRGSRVSQPSAGVTAGRGYCRKGSSDVNGEINTMWSQCVSHSY